MQPLVITQSSLEFFSIKLTRPLTVAGQTIYERSGYYLTIVSSEGLRIQGEAAPLPGVSTETLRKAQHDLEEIQPYLQQLEVPSDSKALIGFLKYSRPLSSIISPSPNNQS